MWTIYNVYTIYLVNYSVQICFWTGWDNKKLLMILVPPIAKGTNHAQRFKWLCVACNQTMVNILNGFLRKDHWQLATELLATTSFSVLLFASNFRDCGKCIYSNVIYWSAWQGSFEEFANCEALILTQPWNSCRSTVFLNTKDRLVR